MSVSSIVRRLAPLVAVGTVASLATLVMLVFVAPALGAAPPWAWHVGDQAADIGRVAGSPDLGIRAGGDLNMTAQHIRFGGSDGNFEFESDKPETHLNAYTIGTGNRLPISVGGDDGQDLVSFVVRGRAATQKKDLQQWQLGSKVAVAVDGRGRLHLGPLVLVGRVVNGRATLMAALNGKLVPLATAG